MKWTTTMTWWVTVMAAGFAFGADAASTAPTTAPFGPADRLAQVILQKANIHVGVCEMPRVGDGRLAAALAKQNAQVIQALAPDAAAAESARNPAADAHVLGSQVVVEMGNASAIPLQDWVADLLVVADATDANLKEIPAAEVKRVLSPYRGVAIVGQPKTGPGGLTVAGLTAWANQLGGTADIKQDDTGLWAVVKMPALAGGDDWSHFYHGSDGNPVSQDKVITGPQFDLQWLGLPYWSGKFDVHVAAGGREFHAQSTVYWRNGGMPFIVRARSLYNGEILWEHKIAQDFGDIGSLMVATPDRLYIKDGGGAVALDAETGNELIRFDNKVKDDCKWIMLSDDVLITMTGPKRTKEWRIENSPTGKTFDQEQDYENETFYATEMDGWDAMSGKPLWQFKDDRIDPAKTVVRDGHVYFYANYAYAACLDLKTGKQIWKTPAPIEVPKGPGMGLGWMLNLILTPRQSAIATDQVYFINSRAHQQCVAFAVADGKLLWQKMKGKTSNNDAKTAQTSANQMMNYPLALDGKFYDENPYWAGWDPLTGKRFGKTNLFKYIGCGHFTATTSGLLFGQCGGVFDRNDQQWAVDDLYTKAACGVSQFAVDGLLVKAPSDCTSCTAWKGFVVARTSVDDRPQGVRFEKGPAYDAAPPSASSDSSDWPTYRSTSARSASSAAVVPSDAVIRWRYDMAPALKPLDTVGRDHSTAPRTRITPPIAIGGRIFAGTADGAVICLDEAAGHVQWQYWTAGPIISAPTWADGRIYVGSSDGWIYCLTADTGQLAWRYRLAPVDRQTMVYGRLSSPWPILGNVLVQDGVVYATAGLINTLGGSTMCALDAKTGNVKWEDDFFGSQQDNAPSAAGQLAYDKGEIWWHAANDGVREIDAATGKMTLAPDLVGMGMDPTNLFMTNWMSYNPFHGMDIGVLPGGWVGMSGSECFLPGDFVEEPRNQPVFMRTVDGKPQLEFFSLDKAAIRPCMPAWDSKTVFVGGGIWLYGDKTPPSPPWLWEHFSDALDNVAKRRPTKMPPPGHGIDLVREVHIVPDASQGHSAMTTGLGQPRDAAWYSPMLASNSAIMLRHGFKDWYLYAFNRTDQTIMSKVHLDSKPQTNGLALTRAGDVLVSMENGNLICIGAKDATTQPAQ